MPIDFRSINRHRGDFTKKARSAGMGVQEYAKHVLANTGNYDTRTVRQASFAKAATKFKHHALGGSLNIYAGDEPERKYNNTTLILNAMRDNDYSSGYGSLADMELRDSLVANPNFIYGTYPPRDIKTDQSAAEPVRTDMSGNQGVFAAGRDKWEPEQEDKPITELYPIKKSYGFFTGSGMHQLPKYVRREIRERAKRIRNNPHSGRFWDGRYVSPYDPLSHYTPDDYTLVKDWEEYVREKNIPDISKIVPKDPRPLGELDLPYNLPTDGNFGLPVYSAGGELAHSHGAWWPNGLQFVNAGGTHEQNPNMGVQVGVDGEGTPNLVEEGEVIYDDYVFSNRLYPTKKELEEANLPVSYAKKTFAYIAERMGKESEERPNDAVSRRGLEAMLQRLVTIQERQRQERGLVGTQQMEQGAGMPQMPQGTNPQDMLAMQQAGGGQVPPELLAQMAGGAAYGQSEGYAPEVDGEAPEGYGGEGYLSAYGGMLPNEYGGDRNIRRFAKDLAGGLPLFSDAELDDRGRRVLGDGVSQADSDLYYRKFGKKYNRLITRAVRHAKKNPEVLYSKAMAAEQGGDGPVKPQNENMLHVANENRKLKNDARVDDDEHPILDPSEVYGGRLRYSYVLGLLDPTGEDGATKEINGRHLTKKVAKADAVRAYEAKVGEIADRGVYAEPFLGLAYAGHGKGRIRRQLERKGYLMPYTKAYGGNIYDPTVRTASEMMNYTLPTFNGSRGLTTDLFFNSLPQRQAEFSSMLNGIRSPLYPPGATPTTPPPADKKPGDPGKKYMDANLRYASAIGPAVSALVNAFRRPDNSEAKAYESVAANVPNVSVRPRMLSNYMPYNPVSREFALNPVRAQAGATRRANVGLNAGQANALNLALNYQTAPLMGQAIAQADAQNLERMRAVQEFNRGTDAYNAQYDMTAQQQNANNALQRYNLVSTLRSNAAKARSQERADLEEARTQSLAGVFSNIGAIGKENFAYNQMLDSYGHYKPTPNGGIMYNGKEYVPVQSACGGMLTRRKSRGRV